MGERYRRNFGVPLPWRTLLRRLDVLVADGRVEAEGSARARVYRLSSPSNASRPVRSAAGPDAEVPPEDGYLPLSPDAAEVWRLVRRPIVERAPVGYARDFLDAYVPGETWYLPASLRARLLEMGEPPEPERPAGTYARDILGRLRIDLAWASSRLEGNTYSRLDTQNLIEFGQRADGAGAAEAQMILNHKAAIEYLVDGAADVAFDRTTLIALHALLSENLLPDPRDEGRLRAYPVGITGSTYTPLGLGQAIEDCFAVLIEKAAAIPDPFEQAFFAMVHIPYLQPFADVNKRTSRLAANIPLIKANLCPLSFIDVPERAYVDGTIAVYELTRVELLRDVFAWAYARSAAQYRVVRDSLAQPDPLRLRYREELAEVVRATVRSGEPPRREMLRERAEALPIPDADVEGFAERALALLVNLNDGTAARYRLRPSEFHAWRSRFTAP